MRFALATMSLGASLLSLNGCFNVGDDDAAPAKNGQAGEGDGTGATAGKQASGGSAGSSNAGQGGGGQSGRPGFVGRGGSGSSGKDGAGAGGTGAASGTGSTAGKGGSGGDAGDDSGGKGGKGGAGGTGGTDNGGESGTTGGSAGKGGTGGTAGGGTGGTGGIVEGLSGGGGTAGYPTSPLGTCEDYSDKLEACNVIDRAIDCAYWAEDDESACLFGCIDAGGCGDVSDYSCYYFGADNPVKDCVTRCDEYECKNGELLPLVYHCDGEEDCSMGEDEEGCYRCDGHMLRKEAVCDGYVDCTDESDEEGCPPAPVKFPCESGGEEFPAAYRCDGTDDCNDGSDEVDCPVATCGPGSAVERGAACEDAADQLNACGLLPSGALNHCIDGSDHTACEKSCYATANCEALEATLCGDGSTSVADCMAACSSFSDFAPCPDGSSVVRSDWYCDKEDDCEDGSDETNCDFVCLNASGTIADSYVCNGINNCGDNSDESGCNPTCPP